MTIRSLYGNDFQIAVPSSGRAGGATVVTGAVVDMDNHFALRAIVEAGTIPTGSALVGVLRGSDSADGSSGWEHYHETSAQLTSDHDGKLLVLGVEKPRHRYVQLHLTRGPGNINLRSAIYNLSEVKRSKDFVASDDLGAIASKVRP